MSIPSILELRLSFVWTETFPTLVSAVPNAPMANLGQPDTFIELYNKIRQEILDWQVQSDHLRAQYGANATLLAAKLAELNQQFHTKLGTPDKLTVPWPWLGRNYIHHFWQYYFENVEPNNITGKQARDYVVPLRIQIPYWIGSPWTTGEPLCRMMIDGFLYPHGVAAVIMARLLFKQQSAGTGQAGVGTDRMLDWALEIRRGKTFPSTLPDNSQVDLKLDALGAGLLNYLREKMLGLGAAQGARPSEPLTVATVIQGTGGEALSPIITDSNLHKALEGLCSWRDDWAFQANLKPIAQTNLLIGGALPGHVVHHTLRGRAVWMPEYFASTASRDMHKLSCYHRNLTLVSLHTEMLAQLCVLYTDYLDRGETAPAELEALTRSGAIRLGFLYGALKKGSKKYTYNSASPRVYLDENDYVAIVNQARTALKLQQPLAYKPR